MAIEQTKIVEILNGEADAEAKANSLLDLFNKDTEEQLTKVKLNREEIKKEKTQEIEKRHAIETELENTRTQLKQAQEQLTKNSPEEMEKFYNSKLADQEKVFTGQLSDLKAKLEESQNKCMDLEKVQFRSSCMEQFNKAIVGKNISPDMLENFSLVVLGPDCCKFAERSLGEGKTAIVTNEGQTIESAVKAALETSFGKACVAFTSTGGGAEGGASSGKSSDKTITRSEFESKSQFEKMQLMKDGFRIV